MSKGDLLQHDDVRPHIARAAGETTEDLHFQYTREQNNIFHKNQSTF